MSTAVISHPPRTMLEVFKSLPEGTSVQLIQNNIVMSPAPKYKHQEILMKIISQILPFVENKNLGNIVVAPVDVYLGADNVYQPDIIFIGNERLSIIEEDGLHGAPDLIIEILSPGTAQYDLGEKKAVYEQYGVQEYWAADPDTRAVQGYYLKSGLFEKIPSKAGEIPSKLLHTTFYF